MSTIILIAGGSGSGKTTITKNLAKRLDCAVIHHDRYYKNVPVPHKHNYDEPAALDNQRLQQDLTLLKANKDAYLPIYDFSTHTDFKPPRFARGKTEKVGPFECED